MLAHNPRCVYVGTYQERSLPSPGMALVVRLRTGRPLAELRIVNWLSARNQALRDLVSQLQAA